jgi:DNA phosphorothioation-dependent restriction protein DptG
LIPLKNLFELNKKRNTLFSGNNKKELIDFIDNIDIINEISANTNIIKTRLLRED